MVEVFKRKGSKREIRSLMNGENARESLGELYSGCEIYGLTKGQFSLIHLLQAILDQTGPADVSIATWTAARAEIDTAYKFLQDGNVKSLRFLVDRSFPTRQPAYCSALIEKFGKEAIRVTRTHAKFLLIKNEVWNIVVRTSMNLNENPRVENFEISDDPRMYEFMNKLVEDVWDQGDWDESNFEVLGRAEQKRKDASGGLGKDTKFTKESLQNNFKLNQKFDKPRI